MSLSLRYHNNLYFAFITGFLAKLLQSFFYIFIFQKCGNYKVSDKDKYPTFARTYPTDTAITSSLLALLEYYNWTKVSIVTGIPSEEEADETSANWDRLRKHFKIEFPEHNITIQHDKTFKSPNFEGIFDGDKLLQKIVDNTHVTSRSK